MARIDGIVHRLEHFSDSQIKLGSVLQIEAILFAASVIRAYCLAINERDEAAERQLFVNYRNRLFTYSDFQRDSIESKSL